LEEKITLASELKLLSLDSLSFIEVIIEIEDATGVEFDIDELGLFNWETVGDIVNSMEEKCYGKICN
jgi:acyl carrier protein